MQGSYPAGLVSRQIMEYVFCYGGMGAFPQNALNCDRAIPQM